MIELLRVGSIPLIKQTPSMIEELRRRNGRPAVEDNFLLEVAFELSRLQELLLAFTDLPRHNIYEDEKAYRGAWRALLRSSWAVEQPGVKEVVTGQKEG